MFFDTNAVHCAGIVRKGFARHVIRFDFDVRGFNPSRSIVKRLVSFILCTKLKICSYVS